MSTAEQDYSNGVSATEVMAFNQVTDNTTLNSNSWTFSSQVNNTIDNAAAIASCVPAYDWWHYNYYPQPWYLYPTYTVEDKGKQAFELVKKLQEIKLIKLTTAKQFADTMDAVLKVL